MFYPPKGGAGLKLLAKGRSVCQSCPVRKECLDEAIALDRSNDENIGLRGGMTPQERRNMKRALLNKRPEDLL